MTLDRYDDIDDERAVASLSDVGDFEDFAAHVANWLGPV
jgi:hypothetical protein